jgi:hypothetical protein
LFSAVWWRTVVVADVRGVLSRRDPKRLPSHSCISPFLHLHGYSTYSSPLRRPSQAFARRWYVTVAQRPVWCSDCPNIKTGLIAMLLNCRDEHACGRASRALAPVSGALLHTCVAFHALQLVAARGLPLWAAHCCTAFVQRIDRRPPSSTWLSYGALSAELLP